MSTRSYDFLPDALKRYCEACGKDLFELRIRADKPVYANVSGEYREVVCKNRRIVLGKNEINEVVMKACGGSVYAFNDTIRNGYIVKNGIRIGLSGRVVKDDGRIITLDEYSSLCIRIPHEIKGCAECVRSMIEENGKLKSLLVISPPGVGKTTLLRDLARLISQSFKKNVLIIDEKNELYSEDFDLGDTSDVLLGCDKKFGLYTAVRNLCPDALITDELGCASDADGLTFARSSGVAVYASVHGVSVKDAERKGFFDECALKRCFDEAIVLEREKGKVRICERASFSSD